MIRQQSSRQKPTVGDTINVVHRVQAPTDALVQPRSPVDSLLATLVSAPTVTREGDTVRIGYTIAVWAPGTNQLEIPGPLLLNSDGTVDTLPASRVALDVASVLPEGMPVESLVPRQAQPWVERNESSWLPMAVLLLPIALLLIIATFFWRRNRKVPTPARAWHADQVDLNDRVIAWLEAGEAGLAVDHLNAHLPSTAPADEWRANVSAVRYQVDGEVKLARLAREGLGLLETPAGES